MSNLPEYLLDRVFDALREMVWRAWTDPELLSSWYARGETIIHKFDLKPGGLGLNEMRWRDNSDRRKIVFQEVAPHEKLVWHHSSSDSDWNIIANPMMPDWPRVILTIVTLEHMGAKTKVRLTWEPFEATDAEIACFAGAVDNMSGGWESGYVIMDEMFVELQAVNT